jgi:BRCT domain type II-containing protein
MITHKESIFIERDATGIEQSVSVTAGTQKKIKPTAITVWSISITGDLETDDPKEATRLLEELQGQVTKIRAAYA